MGARQRLASAEWPIRPRMRIAYQARLVPSETNPCSRSSQSKISARVRGSAVNSRNDGATRRAISSSSGVSQAGAATSSAAPKRA